MLLFLFLQLYDAKKPVFHLFHYSVIKIGNIYDRYGTKHLSS